MVYALWIARNVPLKDIFTKDSQKLRECEQRYTVKNCRRDTLQRATTSAWTVLIILKEVSDLVQAPPNSSLGWMAGISSQTQIVLRFLLMSLVLGI